MNKPSSAPIIDPYKEKLGFFANQIWETDDGGIDNFCTMMDKPPFWWEEDLPEAVAAGMPQEEADALEKELREKWDKLMSGTVEDPLEFYSDEMHSRANDVISKYVYFPGP